MTEPTGYLSIVLHAHLPFIRHPEHPVFLEENWLFEAMTDCYVPLLKMFEGLHRDGVPGRLAMSITPPLAAMLGDELLMDRYENHLRGLVELARREMERTRSDAHRNRLAHMYRDRFEGTLHAFLHEYDRNLLAQFRRWQDEGRIEIIASAATHGYLPLLNPHFSGAEVQIDVGIEAYRRAFGRDPEGFWLPECGYAPPLDELLASRGVRWFIVESHGLLHARPRPRWGVHAPVFCPGSGVAAFARDTESSKQVWSATEGYPGDFDYRDFYRDIGYDLDYDYVRPWLKSDERGHTGIKYYRITGIGDYKELYDPDAAAEKAAQHAGNFMFNRELQIRHLRSAMDRPPVVVAPYDAELFGHWWFEGPRWLDVLLRKIAYDQNSIELITPGDYLRRHPGGDEARPSPSSWGYGGYSEVWLNESNDWIYRHLHEAERSLHTLVAKTKDEPAFETEGTASSPLLHRALNQALRELLLAQSSDWAFIMSSDTHVPYAVQRTRTHLVNCRRLCNQIESGRIEENFLADLETRHNIFPWIDWRALRPTASAPRPAVFAGR